MDVRLAQPAKAKSPIDVREEGRVTSVSREQFWKAALSMAVTPSGRTTVLNADPLNASGETEVTSYSTPPSDTADGIRASVREADGSREWTATSPPPSEVAITW